MCESDFEDNRCVSCIECHCQTPTFSIRGSRTVSFVERTVAKIWNKRHNPNPQFTSSVPLTMCGHLHAKLPGE